MSQDCMIQENPVHNWCLKSRECSSSVRVEENSRRTSVGFSCITYNREEGREGRPSRKDGGWGYTAGSQETPTISRSHQKLGRGKEHPPLEPSKST